MEASQDREVILLLKIKENAVKRPDLSSVDARDQGPGQVNSSPRGNWEVQGAERTPGKPRTRGRGVWRVRCNGRGGRMGKRKAGVKWEEEGEDGEGRGSHVPVCL